MTTANINLISRAALALLTVFSIMFAAGCEPANNANSPAVASPSPSASTSPATVTGSAPATTPSPAASPSPVASPSPKAKTASTK